MSFLLRRDPDNHHNTDKAIREVVSRSDAHLPDTGRWNKRTLSDIVRRAGETALSGSNLVSLSLASASLWKLSKEAIIAPAGLHPHFH